MCFEHRLAVHAFDGRKDHFGPATGIGPVDDQRGADSQHDQQRSRDRKRAPRPQPATAPAFGGDPLEHLPAQLRRQLRLLGHAIELGERQHRAHRLEVT